MVVVGLLFLKLMFFWARRDSRSSQRWEDDWINGPW